MRSPAVTSRPVMALTLCLFLISSQIGESYRFSFLGIRLGELSMFKPTGSSDALAPSSSPSPAPAPAPAPARARAPSKKKAPGPRNSDFDTSPGEAVGLEVGFYDGKCSSSVDVEAIIAEQTQEEFKNDPTILPALLRMQFHDCFVHGCDASILIDGQSTEKTAGPNGSVRGYEFIEAVKATLEEQCPGVVSCADIIAVATKELIRLGQGLDYPVQTGRRDGLVSRAQDVNLPSPDMTASEAAAFFDARGFSAEEMVALLGCHTVGITHCNFFQERINPGSGKFDRNMDPRLRSQLIALCQNGPGTPTRLNQDPTNENTVDNTFYGQLLANRGILPVDQDLSRDSETRRFVLGMAGNNTLFNIKLANAMIKLQAFEVLTAASSTARMHGLAVGPRSGPSLAPSPLPSDDGDSGPPSDMGPSPSDMAPPPTPLGPTSPVTPPAPAPPTPSPLPPPPPASLAPSTAPFPSSPGPSQHPTPPSTSLPLPPQSATPPPPLAPPPQSPSPPPASPPTTSPTPPSPAQPSTPPSVGSPTPSGLQVGFYKARCPTDVEALIVTLVAKEFSNDSTILPALLRMQFHDCFVHGCDASILIDGPETEKTAGPNLSVRGYEFIDALKAAVEEQCPGMVSCADIIAIATKEVLKLVSILLASKALAMHLRCLCLS
ncbi:hypothetical protein Cgig2_000889 [Carnegiea gigantea]|uniref:peroxidase n=1 Tax=Carnegiea gigantea TaxID=171969 RepID=A0A9Q1JJQ2_9CARY|nr:hypothetical protein Cgig2_000889 [Carnegiea gigantea]